MAQRSKVEISANWAPYYDYMMDVLFLGGYRRFMADVIDKMRIQPGEHILDLGSGTGRNAALMLQKVGSNGRIVGIDISEKMLDRARRRSADHSQISFLKHRIEGPLPFADEFDRVFLSFVLHGFEDEDKRAIIANARNALRPDGSLWILDYNEFDLHKVLWPLRWLFIHFECELATEFLELDLKRMLNEGGFPRATSHELMRGYLRLLAAHSHSTEPAT